MKTSFLKSIAITGFLITCLWGAWHNETGGVPETALARVTRTGVIRCGYVTWAPYLSIDPQTGAKSGIAYDFMQAIGDEMGVRVDWVEEVGWGNFSEGLATRRYDVMCVPVWESGQRAKAALLTQPMYDNGLYAYAPENDKRFGDTIDELNKNSVRVVVIEGDVMQQVRRMRLPAAQELVLPQMATEAESLLSVMTHKADIALDNPFGIALYNKTATIKMRPVAGNKPLRLFANSLAVRLGESDLKAALDSSISACRKKGTASSILSRYPGFSPTTNP